MELVRIALAVALVVGTWGCSDKSGKTADETAPTVTPGETTTTPVTDTTDTTDTPVTEPGDVEPDTTPPDIQPVPPGGNPMNATCVGNCVQRNGMRAVSAEQIESDCEAFCDTCIGSCVERDAMKAVGPDQIEADCRTACENVQ